MKYIRGLIQRILQYDTQIKPTGRWNLEYCDKKLHYKVGLSNEDNCGACSQYALTKKEANNTHISMDNDSSDVNTKV
ncbi:MAG: hypothetical protein MUP82_11105 [Candidatus Marinimicrobia bacterium]|nr:hypothetical protein [Candidatus Neomarinimicrobiota bacterium]